MNEHTFDFFGTSATAIARRRGPDRRSGNHCCCCDSGLVVKTTPTIKPTLVPTSGNPSSSSWTGGVFSTSYTNVSSSLVLILQILLLLTTVVKSINCSSISTAGGGGRGGSGTTIDMDPYYLYQQQQLPTIRHPHRHSRTNNMIMKSLISTRNSNYNGDNESNAYHYTTSSSSSSTNSDMDNNISFNSVSSSGLGLEPSSPTQPMQDAVTQVLYANGATESTLPECAPWSVCNKIETYEKPWVEKQCKCSNHLHSCSTTVSTSDPYTLYDKTRQYKLCEPVRELKKCRYFRDVTWTITTKGDNVTSQIVHCQCPKDSVAYMIKRGVYRSSVDSSDSTIGFKYSFACSPISRALCQRKEPCRLFTLKRRSNHTVNDVNSNVLCQCPKGFTCPSHHLDAGVIRGKLYPENSLRTYSGYCIQ